MADAGVGDAGVCVEAGTDVVEVGVTDDIKVTGVAVDVEGAGDAGDVTSFTVTVS